MPTMHRAEDIAQALLRTPPESLDDAARKVVHHIAARKHIARNLARSSDEAPAFGQRAADAVARFGGSWTFVALFAASIVGWTGLNAVLLLMHGTTFDPYPYILLNLFLSMLAAIQAPIILMSQAAIRTRPSRPANAFIIVISSQSVLGPIFRTVVLFNIVGQNDFVN
jgi:uncharacterized membrane protein